MAWLYVPALEASNLDLNPELMATEPYVTSRAKPLRSLSLSRKYKKEQYMKRLSGLTLKPSTANLGVLKWISSQEDSHASPIQVLGTYLEKKTQETYGRTFKESLARFDPDSYSWRTYQTSIIQLPPQSLETWPKWGMTRRGVLYALQTLAHPIGERDGSSWPTPTASEAEKAGLFNKGQMGNSLVAKAKRGELFPTPTASDGVRTNFTYGAGNLTLKGHVMTYPTPTAREPNDVGLNLDRGRYSNDTLTRKVSNQEGLKNGGRLNPEWVEWLMGWPIGWTDSEDAVTG